MTLFTASPAMYPPSEFNGRTLVQGNRITSLLSPACRKCRSMKVARRASDPGAFLKKKIRHTNADTSAFAPQRNVSDYYHVGRSSASERMVDICNLLLYQGNVTFGRI